MRKGAALLASISKYQIMKPTILSNRPAVMKTLSSLVLALATVCAAAAQTPLRIGFVDPALPKNPPTRNAAALAFAQSQGEVARIAWQTTGGWLAPDGKIRAPEEFDVVWFYQGDDLSAAKLDAAAGADWMTWLEGGGTLLVSGAAGSVLNNLGIEPTRLRVLGASEAPPVSGIRILPKHRAHPAFAGLDVTQLVPLTTKGGNAMADFYGTAGPGGEVTREKSDLDAYTKYLKAQVSELLTNSGPVFTLWFDVPQKFDATRGAGVINLARAIQPDIVINNRTGHKGDYDTPEQRIGGFQIDRPWETCMTICNQWAWKPDDKMKSLKECIQTLIRTNGGHGNLLFNVGPQPDGLIEDRQVERLKEMGARLAKNGEAVYETRGGSMV